ncbi:GNAT family N-acetyltransferase [Asanoa sp. NPDC050611]|uniref:GNAT family N-acetyltransferase n=1 Tax=Asanoa sp. NPDC050611 TaxID=3157098 RepID=UPI0033FBE8A6
MDSPSRVRSAARSDIPVLSRLLTQLYAFELPGLLRGDPAAQAEFVRRLVLWGPLDGRFVLVRGDEVVATGAVATIDAPRPPTASGALLSLPSLMGAANAVKSLVGVARGLLIVASPPAADEAQIHSVVVDDRARGQGAGAEMMAHLEHTATAAGKRRAVLQVVSSNAGARAFYANLGYTEGGPTHGRLRSAVGFRSVLMHKDLAPTG